MGRTVGDNELSNIRGRTIQGDEVHLGKLTLLPNAGGCKGVERLYLGRVEG